MLAQSIKASRQPLARIVRQHAFTTRRTFITATAVRQADIVQDLYLRELKAYKLPQVKPSDAEGSVQKFSSPKPPKSPEETDLANDLKAYETQQVEVEGQSSDGEATATSDDWFEDDD
ncbi:ATP synthase H chain, partial [Patellaria atrata CBS 101060]